MSFTHVNWPAVSSRITRSRWVRSAIVAGLAFTMSACAYDSLHYSSYSGYSSYSHGYYDRGQNHRSHYAKRPHKRSHAKHRESHQQHRVEKRRNRAAGSRHQQEHRRHR